MPLEIAFRYELTADDPARIRELVSGSGFFYPAEVDVAEELALERLSKGAASGYEFVFAEQRARTVGYACYGQIACTVASFDLYWIAVDAACRRQGIGRLLLDESERLVRQSGGRQIYVETSGRTAYEPTRGFYRDCGYEEAAVFSDFYAPGDDKVVYRKLL